MPVLVARLLMPDVDPEAAYGKIALALLPTGMIGVVAAAMLAATMSALDSSWNINSAVLTKDVYQRLIRPDAGDRELLNVGRVATALVGVCATSIAVTIALTETRLFGMAQTVVSIFQGPTVIPVLLGLVVLRLPRWSALMSVVVGVLAYGVNEWLLPQMAIFSTDGVPFALRFAISAGGTAAFLVVCAWLFPVKGAARERITPFFEKLRTPAERPAIPATDVPNPLRIIGVFVSLVGALMTLMVFLPQDTQDRLLTLLGGVFLVGIGIMMRWYGGRTSEQRSADEPRRRDSWR
jgi:Na+/proline symporter